MNDATMLNPLKTNRHEIKFVIDWRQYLSIKKEIQRYCRVDKYVPERQENYRITNLYYDSPDMQSYMESTDGDQIKRKIRLRSYSNTDCVFIELKEKYGQILSKKRFMTSLEKAYQFMNSSDVEGVFGTRLPENEKSTLREIGYITQRFKMRPKVVVSYIRQPFVSIYDYNTRVTFDYDVRFRDYDLCVEKTGGGKRLLPSENFIMEVKYNNSQPRWLIPILNRYNVKLQKMSKYAESIDVLIHSNRINQY